MHVQRRRAHLRTNQAALSPFRRRQWLYLGRYYYILTITQPARVLCNSKDSAAFKPSFVSQRYRGTIQPADNIATASKSAQYLALHINSLQHRPNRTFV